MRTKYIILISMCCFVTGYQPANAQSTGKQVVMAAMQSLADTYAAKKNLSFSVVYRYAMEAQPGTWLDSLKGSFQISSDRYRYRLDSTEFLGNNGLSVILFRADKLIYLAKPSPTTRSNNPLALLDSVLWKKDGIDGEVDDMGASEKIVLRFKPGGSVKRVEYYIDKTSGMLTRTISTVDSRQLYDASVRPQMHGAISYVIVESDFTNYNEAALPDSDFDPAIYVKKMDGQYVAQAPYQSYKIFLANPDL